MDVVQHNTSGNITLIWSRRSRSVTGSSDSSFQATCHEFDSTAQPFKDAHRDIRHAVSPPMHAVDIKSGAHGRDSPVADETHTWKAPFWSDTSQAKGYRQSWTVFKRGHTSRCRAWRIPRWNPNRNCLRLGKGLEGGMPKPGFHTTRRGTAPSGSGTSGPASPPSHGARPLRTQSIWSSVSLFFPSSATTGPVSLSLMLVRDPGSACQSVCWLGVGSGWPGSGSRGDFELTNRGAGIRRDVTGQVASASFT